MRLLWFALSHFQFIYPVRSNGEDLLRALLPLLFFNPLIAILSLFLLVLSSSYSFDFHLFGNHRSLLPSLALPSHFLVGFLAKAHPFHRPTWTFGENNRLPELPPPIPPFELALFLFRFFQLRLGVFPLFVPLL